MTKCSSSHHYNNPNPCLLAEPPGMVWLVPIFGATLTWEMLAGSSLGRIAIGTGVSAISLAILAYLVCCAARKPALQALSVATMVACTRTAIAVTKCSILCSLLAIVPVSLAGKQAWLAHGPRTRIACSPD